MCYTIDILQVCYQTRSSELVVELHLAGLRSLPVIRVFKGTVTMVTGKRNH